MPLKGQIQPDHIPNNKYSLRVVGLVEIIFTEISGLEEVLDVVDLPDRTRASGGNSQAFEFTAILPLHHDIAYFAMEAWLVEGKDPVSSTYKKSATLTLTSGTGLKKRSYTITGLWVSGRKLPDLSFENEGEMAVAEYTFQADEVLPI